MRAAAALMLLAVWAAPVSAGFRYVPPAETEAAAEPAEKGSGADIEPRAGPGPGVHGASVSGASVSGPKIWRVHAGEMLREALARWSARAGADVLFLTDRRYRIERDVAFEGAFADAVQALFGSLSHLPHAPVAARAEGGTTLVVRHRMPGFNRTEAVP